MPPVIVFGGMISIILAPIFTMVAGLLFLRNLIVSTQEASYRGITSRFDINSITSNELVE